VPEKSSPNRRRRRVPASRRRRRRASQPGRLRSWDVLRWTEDHAYTPTTGGATPTCRRPADPFVSPAPQDVRGKRKDGRRGGRRPSSDRVVLRFVPGVG